MNTMTVEFTCPASGCRRSHTAVVKAKGQDRAETACAGCGNRVVAKTRDGKLVETEVL